MTDVHLRDLRSFLAVAEELHFTRAAQRLFVSQPALSRQIGKLEADLRVELFVRDQRSVALTAPGRALLDAARGLLADWDEARRAVSDAAAAAASVVRVGIPTPVERGVLADLSRRLESRRPGWRLDVVQVNWDDPTCGLADGSTDLAVMWLPLPDRDGYHHRLIASERRHVALSRSHPLAERTSVAFDELADDAFVALPERAGPPRDFWLATAHRHGEPARIATSARNADEALEAVAGELGVVLIAEGNAALYARPAVVTVPVTDLPPAELALVWRAGDDRDVVRDLVEGPAPSDGA